MNPTNPTNPIKSNLIQPGAGPIQPQIEHKWLDWLDWLECWITYLTREFFGDSVISVLYPHGGRNIFSGVAPPQVCVGVANRIQHFKFPPFASQSPW
jgi:hypothetical protein